MEQHCSVSVRILLADLFIKWFLSEDSLVNGDESHDSDGVYTPCLCLTHDQ